MSGTLKIEETKRRDAIRALFRDYPSTAEAKANATDVLGLKAAPVKFIAKAKSGKPVTIAFDLYVVADSSRLNDYVEPEDDWRAIKEFKEAQRKSEWTTHYDKSGQWTTRYEGGAAAGRPKLKVLEKVVEATELPKRQCSAGEPLTSDDYDSLAARWIDRETADAACLRRVEDLEGKSILRRKPGGSAVFDGVLIPYFLVGESRPCTYRIRRNHPDVEYSTDSAEHGKEVRKYVAPMGDQNRLYFAAGTTKAHLVDVDLPICITEGEFKTLALSRLARESAFLPIGLSGVWNWKGRVGTRKDAAGKNRPVSGVLPEFDAIDWKGRLIYLAFDSDCDEKEGVQAALTALTRELQKRGAVVHKITWARELGKGIDDALATEGGPGIILQAMSEAEPLDEWRKELIVNKDKNPKPIMANALTMFRSHPDWAGLLRYDRFKMKVLTKGSPPWGGEAISAWTDHHSILAAEWLQRQGLIIGEKMAGDAAVAVAKENSFDPVQDFMNGLQWDGTERLDKWLTTYFGASSSPYIEMIGPKFFLAMVARAFQPGCKADHMLILEGGQGVIKSSILKSLVPEADWFTDCFDRVEGKDAKIALQGRILIEVAEFDKLGKSEAADVKAFLTTQVDSFRAPYGRFQEDYPRRAILVGTTNASEYLHDASGGRRFWPVKVGTIDLPALKRDVLQLFAEAVVRFRAGEQWWPEAGAEREFAEAEQRARYVEDPWASVVLDWCKDPGGNCGAKLKSTKERVFTSEILEFAVCKPLERVTPADKNRVAAILKHAQFQPHNSHNLGRCFLAPGQGQL